MVFGCVMCGKPVDLDFDQRECYFKVPQGIVKLSVVGVCDKPECNEALAVRIDERGGFVELEMEICETG